jgi:N-acetylglucosamine-6-sulfatase
MAGRSTPPGRGQECSLSRSGYRLASIAIALCAGLTLGFVAPETRDDGRPPKLSTRSERPNFVLVLVDDLDETGGPYWDAMPKTRSLIAERGLRFTRAFAPNPLCCPARATILTGMYPHNTGVWTEAEGGYREFATGVEDKTVAVRLREAGYTTAFAGKYVNGYERDFDAVPPGWDEWFGLGGNFLDGFGYKANHNGRIESYGSALEDYQTDVLSREGVSFLERTEAADRRPFFLLLAPSAPHWPMKPARRHASNRFANDPLPRRANFDEADVSDKPYWLRDGVHRLDDAAIAEESARYRRGMGTLFAVDDMVAKLAATLKKNGDFDRTVFVFSSDNGYNRGAHRLLNKMAPYEESTRIPLAIAGPGTRKGREDRLVTHADFAPTLLDMAGVPVPDDIDGRSMSPLLHHRKGLWRTDFLSEFHGTYNAFVSVNTLSDVQGAIADGWFVSLVPITGTLVPTYRAVRNDDWLYVEWYAGNEHDYELYDMHSDPYQLSNLLATPDGAAQHAPTAAALQSRLDALAACRGVSCR